MKLKKTPLCDEVDFCPCLPILYAYQEHSALCLSFELFFCYFPHFIIPFCSLFDEASAPGFQWVVRLDPIAYGFMFDVH